MPPDLRNPPPGCRFAPRCAFAMAVCREVVPPEVTFADGVRVACHLYPTSDAPMAGEAGGGRGAARGRSGHDAIPHEHPAHGVGRPPGHAAARAVARCHRPGPTAAGRPLP